MRLVGNVVCTRSSRPSRSCLHHCCTRSLDISLLRLHVHTPLPHWLLHSLLPQGKDGLLRESQ